MSTATAGHLTHDDLGDPKYAQQIVETAIELDAGLIIVDTLRKAAPAIRATGEGSMSAVSPCGRVLYGRLGGGSCSGGAANKTCRQRAS